MNGNTAIEPAATLDAISRRLVLIDATACRGLEGEIDDPAVAFGGILDAVGEASKQVATLRRAVGTVPTVPDANEPTIAARAERARRLVTLIAASVSGGPKSSIQSLDLFCAIRDAAQDASEELYWVIQADASSSPAPTDDQRDALARRRQEIEQ